MVSLSRITVFPIKSLDGVSVEACDVLSAGALRNDRRWVMVDEQGKFLNGKRSAKVHAIRTEFDLEAETVVLALANHSPSPALHLTLQREQINLWLSEALGQRVHLEENTEGGFPDDTERPGPTVVSNETLRTVAQWFPEIEPKEVRGRFRANLEVDSNEPFWEDRLVGTEGRTPVQFTIGAVAFEGLGICQRCVVPSRHPQSGETISGFAKRFSQYRSEGLPPWSPRERFDHFFRLAVNTRRLTPGPTATIVVGDAVSIGG